MKTWDQLYDYCLTDLDGCTAFAAANELRKAAQEFCDRTKAWRVQLDPTITTANTDVYDFELGTDRELVRIEKVKFNGVKQSIFAADDETQYRTGLQAIDGRQFQVFPMPAPGVEIAITASVKPSNTAKGLEDALFAQYARQIGYGARAELMMKVNKPYSNPTMAAIMAQQFEAAIARASKQAAKAFSTAPLRTRARFL